MESRDPHASSLIRNPRDSNQIEVPGAENGIHFSHPIPADGAFISRLVSRCVGLDPNSPYAYVMLCDVFAATTIIARDARDSEGELLGFVSGFQRPEAADRIFLWQVGVDERARGRGLGRALLEAFIRTERAAAARILETTITPDNASSLALFGKFAANQGSSLERIGRYEAAWLGASHAPEDLYQMPLALPRRNI